MTIGDSVVFSPAAQLGIAALMASMGALFIGRGMTLSTCNAVSKYTQFLKRGKLAMIFILGFDARISPTILVYALMISFVVRLPLTSFVPSMNCTISGLLVASH